MNDDTFEFCRQPRKTRWQGSRKTFAYSSMTEKNKESLKPVGSRPGVMYGSCKAHKASVENYPQFVGQLPVIGQICRLWTLPSTNLRNSRGQF